MIEKVRKEKTIKVKTPKVKVDFSKDDIKTKMKYIFMGNNEKKGLIEKIVCYALLILFGFVYLYPMLYMLAYSFMSPSDVVNPLVNYFPTSWYFTNYVEAAQALSYGKTLLQTLVEAVAPAIFQTASTMLVAYGLARFEFKGKKIIFGCIILTFIVPQQITMIPQIMLFKDLGLLDSLLSFIVPAAFGQGIKSAVFILIFYQFFSAIPKSVEEAAKIDGATSLQIFWKVGIPTALPAIILSFLLSVVWYYNETVLSAIYFGSEWTTLPLELAKLQASYEAIFGTASTTGKSINDAIYMAGTLLSIIPLLFLFFFTQRFFVDGIDKAGITGE
ncbi:MAG: carbohydrate ABC transporter permease [Clostridia bacterium]